MGEHGVSMVKRLKIFLSLPHPSFRCLGCLGFIPPRSTSSDRHGIAFHVPDDTLTWGFKSLSDLLPDPSLPLAHLQKALEIARTLAGTVLELHTAGWMHKGLRLENVVFLAPQGSNNKDFFTSESYVLGYEPSWPRGGGSLPPSTPPSEAELAADLYRHPLARRPHQEEPSGSRSTCTWITLCKTQFARQQRLSRL